MITDPKILLIEAIQKESALRNKNNFLLSKVLKKRDGVKALLPDKIDELDVMVFNELLIKKILEYRQMRNYIKEEETSVTNWVNTLRGKLTVSQNKALILMDIITKKQDLMVASCQNLELNSEAANVKKMKHLTNQLSGLLFEMCKIISEKHKQSTKLFWYLEKRRKIIGYGQPNMSFITYDNLLQQNKLLQEKIVDRKIKINKTKSILDDILKTIKDLKTEKKYIEKNIGESLTSSLENGNLVSLNVSTGNNVNTRIKQSLFAEIAATRKKIRILNYLSLAPNKEIIPNAMKVDVDK